MSETEEVYTDLNPTFARIPKSVRILKGRIVKKPHVIQKETTMSEITLNHNIKKVLLTALHCNAQDDDEEEEIQQALSSLQILLDEVEFWKQTATDMEKVIRESADVITSQLGYTLNGALENYYDAIDARGGK